MSGGIILIIIAIIYAAAFYVYYRISDEIRKKDMLLHSARNEIETTKNAVKKLNDDLLREAEKVNEQESLYSQVKQLNSALSKKINNLQEERDRQILYNTQILSKLRTDTALLPTITSFIDGLQKTVDTYYTDHLVTKRHPAPKAADDVKKALREARDWKHKATAYQNQIALYEAQAPWLIETLDYSLDEVIEGLRIDEEERQAWVEQDDPAMAYIPTSEWKKLSPSQRNQIALDRYFERRQSSAWLAGILYERYIGYLFERDGFSVEYRGATKGFNDLGIDLVCEKGGRFTLVQCKRLSEKKKIPVRENVIAQCSGAALFFAYEKGVEMSKITTLLSTTYVLSETAKRFADCLGIKYRERTPLERYPCIKCNVSSTGGKIYHLPFDQKYDLTKIYKPGEFYAMTVEEAEMNGFRRAFRWIGNFN